MTRPRLNSCHESITVEGQALIVACYQVPRDSTGERKREVEARKMVPTRAHNLPSHVPINKILVQNLDRTEIVRDLCALSSVS